MANKKEDYRKAIEDQMQLEMDEIERMLEENPEIAQMKAGDHIKEAMDKKLEKDDYEAIIRQLPREYQEDLRLGREVREEKEKKTRQRKYAYWKRMATAVLVVILVGSIGITSVGGPKRVVEFLQQAVENRNVEQATTITENEIKYSVMNEEEEAYQKIKDELGIDPVKMTASSKEMFFKSVEIDTNMQVAYLIYSYDERNITYTIQCLFSEGAWGFDIEDEKVEEFSYELTKTTATVTKYILPESKLEKYRARFDYQVVTYQLVATMEWEEFEQLLNLLHFL